MRMISIVLSGNIWKFLKIYLHKQMFVIGLARGEETD